jgi:hypothetical protein
MIWYLSGIRPTAARWNRPGSSLRLAKVAGGPEQHDDVVVRP